MNSFSVFSTYYSLHITLVLGLCVLYLPISSAVQEDPVISSNVKYLHFSTASFKNPSVTFG